MSSRVAVNPADVEIDIRALVRSLFRALPVILLFAALVGGGVFYFLSHTAPIYKAETTLLIETGESSITRTDAPTGSTDPVLDEQAVTSQVQLIRSRDLARSVAGELHLATQPEYVKAVTDESLVKKLLAKLGLARSPSDASSEEKVLKAYYDNLQVFALDKSRIITIDFSSTDPKLAAAGANAIADGYIALQRSAKRDNNAQATNWLESEISDLRVRVKDAEAKVEQFRASNNLFTNGDGSQPTLPQQQLADLNAELSRLRAAQVDAQTKADQIRAALKSGTVPNVTEVVNSPLIQRLIEQQVALRSSIAELSATLLPEHPRMKELLAQVSGLDAQISREAAKIVDALEAEADLSQTRAQQIAHRLEEQKVSAADANQAEVQMRALEREAAAERDLLDTYLRRYREALARQNGDYLPADARVISRATVPVDPDYPKIAPMTLAATIAAFLFAVGVATVRELVSGRPMRPIDRGSVPEIPSAAPTPDRRRWADDHGVRRMMPNEPSLAPPLANDLERALTSISARLVESGKRRIVVTLAEGSEANGRPLAAAALARALVKADRRVVLVDLRGDGADGLTMGQGEGLPGFTDLFAGDASFAQVIFRDRKSRAHFIPPGHRPVSPSALAGDRLESILTALDHTYDHLVLDVGDDMVEAIGATAGAALVVSDFGAGDLRTEQATARIRGLGGVEVLLLLVDPASAAATVESPQETGAAA